MERSIRRLSKKAYYARKIKKAVHLLFYRRHEKPGVKGWELRRALGSDYEKVLKLLDAQLEALDLTVKQVYEGETPQEKPTLGELDKARFYITLRGTLTPTEAKMCGWRIDDLAGLSFAIAYIISKEGKAPRTEVEELLKKKLPGWRVDINMNRYIRTGYLGEDEKGQLFLDWRTRAEVDQKKLVDTLLNI